MSKDNIKAEAAEKLFRAYILSLDCFIKRLEFLASNPTEEMHPLLRSPFIESLPSNLDHLRKTGEQLGLIGK